MRNWGSSTPARTREGECEQSAHSSQLEGGERYLVNCVDENLRVSPSETTNRIGRFAAREDSLDEGYEFTRGGSVADQAS